jgi:hypothetical protein
MPKNSKIAFKKSDSLDTKAKESYEAITTH